jgi:hypothetical protein
MSEDVRFFFPHRFPLFGFILLIHPVIETVLARRTTVRTPAHQRQKRPLEKSAPARSHNFVACTLGAMT